MLVCVLSDVTSEVCFSMSGRDISATVTVQLIDVTVCLTVDLLCRQVFCRSGSDIFKGSKYGLKEGAWVDHFGLSDTGFATSPRTS